MSWRVFIGFLRLRRCIFLLFGFIGQNDTSLTSRLRHLEMLEIVFLTIGVFFQAVCFGVVPNYGSATMRYESDRLCVIGSVGSRYWTSGFSDGMDLVLGLLALLRGNEMEFDEVDEPAWFSFDLETSFVYALRA